MKTKSVTEKNMKVCLVGSSGGHLTHLYMLKPFWKDKNHFWVTFDKEDARSLLEGEKMYPCYYPTNRSLKALIKNTKIAWDVLHKEKPDLIISCGAAVAVPFFYMDSIHCARQKAVKLLDELEQEFRLIERRRQGLGKPNLLYVKDLYAGLSQSNYWKYENHTSGGLKNELPGVLKSNGSNTEKINKTDNSETDLIYPAELQEEEQYRHYFKEALELEILEQGYPADKAVLYEILELLVETVTSRKKFLRICGEEKPKEVVKSRLMKLDSSHIQYILECLKENSTQESAKERCANHEHRCHGQ